MKFAEPLWLLAGLITCAFVLWRYRRFDVRQRASLAQFAATRLLDRLTASVSPGRRIAKRALFVTGLALIFVALARPQAGYVWQETHRKGLELLFAVDTSKSMLSQDVKPDRLTRAKLAVHDLTEKLNGDGVGLVAFAGNAFLQCPITLDYDAFRESLDALDTKTIPRGGTNIAAAIHEAEATFKTRTTNEKILVLITDGEDLEAEGIKAAEAAAKNGVKIFTVGVGSAAGELVPTEGESGGTAFAKDDGGQLVKSKLDETTLKKIADAAGGMYQPLGAQGEGLRTIYDQGLAHFTRQDLSSRKAKVYLEQFHWALLGALACLVSGMLIGTRRKVAAPKRIAARVTAGRRVRPGVATGALALVALALPAISNASPQTAEKAYHSGDFAKAQQDYAATAAKEPKKPELQFNAGSSAYKAGDYAQAAAGFQSTLKSGDVPLQQGAYYNLGNTQFRTGEKTVQSNPQETIKTWEEALKSYDAALQIKADDADAKYNRDLVQRRLDALRKQEEQKKQQQQQQQDQQQQKQDQMDQQRNQDKQDENDQQNQSKDQQQQDSKDSKGDSKDQQNKQQQGSQGDAKDQKDQSQGGKDEQKNQKDTPKDSKGDAKDQQSKDEQPKDQQAKADQQKKDEPSKDQHGKSDEQKDSKDQKNDASEAAQHQPKQGDEKKDQANAGQQPKPEPQPGKKPSKAQAELANGEQPKDDAAAASDERREPGQMTKLEAKQLLDALKNDERKLPANSQSRGAGQPKNDHPLKDW
ncbi:MAG: Ca-activated chloride channel [Chthoniobacter sp.]|jgi:Ca-activated chloride channel family protein|nr:Ca-activated chloride channel [Chthoniobacter sp.]